MGKQIMPTPNFGERNYSDFLKWNPLVGKIFYQRNPNNPDEIRTIRMHYNIFADKLTPQISDYHVATPPEGMQEVNPRLLSALATHQNHSSPGFY